MGLEQKYDAVQSANELGKRIRAAAARFMAEQPDYLPTQANESLMLRTMTEQDLSPTSVGDFHEAFAHCREKLTLVRKQTPRRVPAAPGLTRAEVNSWTAKQLQRELESPRRAKEIEAALSR